MGTPIRPHASDDPLGLFANDTTAASAPSAGPPAQRDDPLGLFSAPAAPAQPERPLKPLERLAAGLSPYPSGAEVARSEGTPGKIISFLAGANQGGTFGFADEVGAAATSLLTGHPIENYQANLDYLRERFKMANEANPKTMLAGEFAGAVASPAARAIGVGKPALSLGGRIGQGALAGGVGGAISGAANAEGGLGDRARGALVGGAAGTAFGAALPLAGAVGGVALDVLHARPKVPIAMAPAVDRARAALRPRSGVGGVSGGGSRAGNIDFTPVARAAAGAYNTLGPRSTAEVADELLLGAARKAGVPLSAAADATRAAGGAPLTAMEVFGVPAQRLGQASRGISGRADETIATALETRHAGQPERILGAMERGLGQEGRGDLFQTADEIVQRRGANAATEYAKAYESAPINPTVRVDPQSGEGGATLLDLFKRPSMSKALARARTIAAEEGDELPPLTRTVEVNGKAVEQPVPVSVKTLHYVKMALDDMVFGAKRGQSVLGEESGGTGPTALAKVQQTRRALLDVMDREVPEYGAARANFAGETALKDALESGRESIGKRMDPRLIEREFKNLSESEQEMYRQGAIDALQQRMESAGSGANKVLRVFDTPADKARLRALFPDDASFAAFTQEMEREAQMAGTRNAVLKGSQTAEKLAAQQELEDDAIDAVVKNSASPLRAGLNFAVTGINNRRRVQTRAVADALAPRLTQGATPMSGTLADLLSGLTEAERRIARRSAARRVVATSAGATAGAGVAKP